MKCGCYPTGFSPVVKKLAESFLQPIGGVTGGPLLKSGLILNEVIEQSLSEYKYFSYGSSIIESRISTII